MKQLSFFDDFAELLEKQKTAISLFDERTFELFDLEEWMRNLLPQGNGFILMDKRPWVLCKTKEKVVREMKYRLFRIGNEIYAATGVGRGEEDPEETEYC